MVETKSPLASLTVLAGAGGIVVSTLSAFGIDIGPNGANQVNAIVTGILAAVAIYGRFRATKRIGGPE